MPTANLNTRLPWIPYLSTSVGANVLRTTEWDKQFAFRRDSSSGTDGGIPMPIYAENILPTASGWESVSYSLKAKRYSHSVSGGFDQLINLKTGVENNILFSPANGKNYILGTNSRWTRHQDPHNLAGLVTTAYTQLRTFICYQRQKVLEFNQVTDQFDQVTLTGLALNNIDGITSSNNALIAWNKTTVYWSSFIDPTDFTPSLSSGAGSQNPTQVRGEIVACLPTSEGFIIYTSANAILARWSGNIRFPWNFTEIQGSAGITSPEHVTHDANYSGHFAWTLAGLQEVSAEGAKVQFPEITDFIAGHVVEEFIGINEFHPSQNPTPVFNSETQAWKGYQVGPNLLQRFYLDSDPWVKLTLVGARYLVISYGYRTQGIYDWAIVYDLALGRFGKLKISHVDAGAYLSQSYADAQAKTYMGFLGAEGHLNVVNFSLRAKADGILFYGKLQESHGRWLTVDSVDVQTLGDSVPELLLIPSMDGTNLEPPAPTTLVIDSSSKRRWLSRALGQNMNLLFMGDFSLTSIQVHFEVEGDR